MFANAVCLNGDGVEEASHLTDVGLNISFCVSVSPLELVLVSNTSQSLPHDEIPLGVPVVPLENSINEGSNAGSEMAIIAA